MEVTAGSQRCRLCAGVPGCGPQVAVLRGYHLPGQGEDIRGCGDTDGDDDGGDDDDDDDDDNDDDDDDDVAVVRCAGVPGCGPQVAVLRGYHLPG